MLGNVLLGFKDVLEVGKSPFADCSLGKLSEMSPVKYGNPDASLSLTLEAYKNCPIENGSWEGERGDSKWKPDPEYVPQKRNPEGKSWEEIMKEHKIDGVEYKNGEPDFKDVSKGKVEIESYTSDRDDNFDKADIEMAKKKGCDPEDVAKWRKENGYTWHERGDMRTMEKVPSIVHNNVSHRGGISAAKAEGK